MKLLHVYGEECSAMFISDDFGIDKAYELAKQKGGQCVIQDDYNYAKVKILEFGEVDPKFIDFIADNFIDYDNSKNKDFFIIED